MFSEEKATGIGSLDIEFGPELFQFGTHQRAMSDLFVLPGVLEPMPHLWIVAKDSLEVCNVFGRRALDERRDRHAVEEKSIATRRVG